MSRRTEITFPYCTEFIVYEGRRLRRPAAAARLPRSRAGDCVVVVEDEEIIKAHVHTGNPGDALQEGLEFGSLTKIKIDDHAAAARFSEKSGASAMHQSAKDGGGCARRAGGRGAG